MAVVRGIDGLPELQKALNDAGPAWSRDLSSAHRVVARRAANLTRRAARGGTRRQRAASASIRASATKTRARLNVANTASSPYALATFWGTKRRTGWYAKPRYAGSGRPQNPAWVGNSWRAAQPGEGPYVINDALAAGQPEIVGVYESQVEAVVKAIAARKITHF